MDYPNIEDLQLKLKFCLDFLKPYMFLTDLYIIEFFTKNHWKKLPMTWQDALSNLSISDIPSNLLSMSNTQMHSVWPLSLLCFMKCSSTLSFSRAYNSGNDVVVEETSYNNCQAMQKHIRPKKRYEIAALSKLIVQVHKKYNCSTVVDVGSGQGHLSRMLNLKSNLPVVAVEHSEEFVNQARIFDRETFERLKKKNASLPKHIPLTISPDIDHETFINILSNQSDTAVRYLLTGLHACGNLSPTMIRLFAESSRIQSLISVACCYIKLTTDSGDLGKNFRSKTYFRNTICYPMSKYTKSLTGHQFSYRALKLACHGIENTREELKRNDFKFQIQTYRAILEHVIISRYPDFKRQAVKKIKPSHTFSFHEYAEIALKRLNLHFEKDYFCNIDTNIMLTQSNKVTILFTLALMLGPVIETVLLLDRMLYLKEHGITSNIVTVFDPCLSPRCFAIVANK